MMCAAMEHVTLESILQSLSLESYLNLFKENDLDYELLRNLSDEKLDKALTDIGLPVGKRIRIADRIQESKIQSMLITNYNYGNKRCYLFKEIDCVNVFLNEDLLYIQSFSLIIKKNRHKLLFITNVKIEIKRF